MCLVKPVGFYYSSLSHPEVLEHFCGYSKLGEVPLVNSFREQCDNQVTGRWVWLHGMHANSPVSPSHGNSISIHNMSSCAGTVASVVIQ